MKNLVLILCMLLGACNSLPKFKTNEPTVNVDVYGEVMTDFSMCTSGTWYSLNLAKKNKNKHSVQLPIGKRISVSPYLFVSSDTGVTSCSPSVSFIPFADETYFINAEFFGGKCFVEVIKKSEESKFGVIKDPTLQKYGCE